MPVWMRNSNSIKDKVKLSGFRPGKVPVSHLKKVYGRSIMAEVVEETVSETTSKAISDRNERPAFQPDIKLPEDAGTVDKVVEGSHDLEFIMSFEVLPQIELADLKELKIERPVAEVSEEEVDQAVERLRENNVSYEAKDGAAEDGDRVTIDFVGKIDGEPFEGGSAEGAPLVISRGGFIPGFEEGLVGAKAGEERTVKASFPEEYQAKHLAGKDAEFDVKVNEVAAPRVPDADDEFAKGLGLEFLKQAQGRDPRADRKGLWPGLARKSQARSSGRAGRGASFRAAAFPCRQRIRRYMARGDASA